MRLQTTAKMALMSLGTHPFRAFLAGLGVVFGVGAVIAMLAIGEGARREALKQVDALGVDKIIVRSIPPDGKSPLEVPYFGMVPDHVRAIENSFENVMDVTYIRKMNQQVYTAKQIHNARVVGVGPHFMSVTNTTLLKGRNFVSNDIEKSLPVCLIGRDVAKALFPFEEALHKSIQVRHQWFRIIGVVDSMYQFAEGYAINNLIMIPVNTANKIYGEMTPKLPGWQSQEKRVLVDMALVKVRSTDQIENTANRLKNFLKRHLPKGEYSIDIPLLLLKQKERTQKIFSIVMGSIAGISLLVGGIGIMNIMLANIYERMKEIGTRRALGAKQRDILIQFLMESVLLTSIGGIMGVGLGLILAYCVELYADMPVGFTMFSIIASFLVSVFTGIAFGTFPAWKAAKLNPIDALRSE